MTVLARIVLFLVLFWEEQPTKTTTTKNTTTTTTHTRTHTHTTSISGRDQPRHVTPGNVRSNSASHDRAEPEPVCDTRMVQSVDISHENS